MVSSLGRLIVSPAGVDAGLLDPGCRITKRPNDETTKRPRRSSGIRL